MLYNFTFLLSSLFFFFLKIWSEIGIRIIHGPALYTGKYGSADIGQVTSTFRSNTMSKYDRDKTNTPQKPLRRLVVLASKFIKS